MEKREPKATFEFLNFIKQVDRISVYYITTQVGNLIVDIKYASSGGRFATLDSTDEFISGLMGWSDLAWCRLTPVNVY